jgi:hypothetical protein
MMSTTKDQLRSTEEALDLALEALKELIGIERTSVDIALGEAAITAIKQARALDKKAENARELGLDYEPAGGTQVSKVWWDGEKLMAKQIPFVEFYKAAPTTQPAPYVATPLVQEPSYWLGYGLQAHTEKPFEDATPLYTTPPNVATPLAAQRQSAPDPKDRRSAWVGLTDEQIDLFINGRGDEDDDDYVEPTGDGFGITDADLVKLVRRAEAKLKEKNNG